MPNRRQKTDRAQIFLPFDSLRGFRQYIQKKEKIKVDPKELMPDVCEVLNRKIHQIQIGQMIQIVYYFQQEYLMLEGMVSALDLEYSHTLKIVDQVIDISTIIEISGEGIDE